MSTYNTPDVRQNPSTIRLGFPDEVIIEVANRAWKSAGGVAEGRLNGIQASAVCFLSAFPLCAY